MQIVAISKNAARKSRRYGQPPAAYAVGERAVWAELSEGGGVARIMGRTIRAFDGTARERKRATIQAGRRWECGMTIG